MGVLYFLTWLRFSVAMSLTVVPVTVLYFYNLFCQSSVGFFFFCKTFFFPQIFRILVALHSLWLQMVMGQMQTCHNIKFYCLSSFFWGVLSSNTLCSSTLFLWHLCSWSTSRLAFFPQPYINNLKCSLSISKINLSVEISQHLLGSFLNFVLAVCKQCRHFGWKGHLLSRAWT